MGKRTKPTKSILHAEKRRNVNQSQSRQNNDGDKDDKVSKIEGFPGADDSDSEQESTRKLVQQQNRKNKKSGGFQSMGLSHHVFKGITRKGYKIPTPIQRKTIPLIMDGKDVVAMARTGSGKTAAFLIPLFESLKIHTAQSGARALIMSPTRELALQTLKFTKEIGKYTGLRAAVILGGDKMEDQFAALHENPDIIIATPGRFLHVIVEMDLKLTSIQYVVFDEADRLFEMGFQEQLQETLKRLPDNRQTLLFSATLPKLLVEFARAGLHDPVLIRLDVDTKLSENLQMGFLQCRMDDKLALLLHILQHVIKPGEQTFVFVATKHHVEYLNMLLTQANIPTSYIYSSLDQTARKINVAKFQHRKTKVMIVTDLAARGIDIPMLDNVINFHFPAKGKLFIHRVGRVARAGRMGTAYSLISPDEAAFVLDLHLFLGRPLKLASKEKIGDTDGVYGCVPQSIIDDSEEKIKAWHRTSSDLQTMKKVSDNGYKQYLRSRPASSSESIKRIKAMNLGNIGIHPVFGSILVDGEEERIKILDSVKSYRPHSTIFEINSTTKTKASEIMKFKRKKHGHVIEARINKMVAEAADKAACDRRQTTTLNEELDSDLENLFSTVVAPKRKANDDGNFVPRTKKKKKSVSIRDEENFLEYRPSDYQTERGLGLGTSFEREAAGAILDLTGDDNKKMKQMTNTMKWDRTKKKYVSTGNELQQKKKIRTESGVWISASYKSSAYKEWVEKTKQHSQHDDDDDDSDDEDKKKGKLGNKKMQMFGHGGRRTYLPDQSDFGGNKRKFKSFKSELKPKDRIVKERMRKEHIQKSQKRSQLVRQKRKSSGRKKY